MTGRTSSRRGWKILIFLLATGLLGAGGAALHAWWPSGESSSVLTVRYRTGAAATADVAKPWLEIINTSGRSVNLSDVTLRYYYTAGGGTAYGSNCVQTSLGCSSVTLRTAALEDPAPKADHYLQIGFTAAAGTLKPGGTSQGIGLQLYRVDHRELNQADDLSFDAKSTTYQPSKLVTAYLDGTHVWGKEPNGDTPAPAASASASASASTSASASASGGAPAGVLFDDFDYTGPDDPALAANGWTVRTGEGGPGIKDTWSKQGVSFPAGEDGRAGQALRLRAGTDGTARGTRQAEFHRTRPTFFTGTLVARVYLSDKPASGADGDHVNESLFAISPDHASPRYSELDYEYMPNGGWGRYGPLLDTTSWRNSERGDRVTSSHNQKLGGWHTMVITAVDGKTTYSIDGQKLFTSGSKHFPREAMTINFSTWFVDLPFKGARSWEMKADWMYYRAGKAVSAADAEKAAARFEAAGTPYLNTLPKS
ncbi:cellulose binding domain-containing protein [Streptomyces graminilatus]|uniref:cellulose binding domain-containing protein n=1 Tax=Streptomyces graminilatus TaxID=1464070 RepID=UPI0007C732BE|nr:cellulose binding domain-containing protein [Streptomyces graminilatus]